MLSYDKNIVMYCFYHIIYIEDINIKHKSLLLYLFLIKLFYFIDSDSYVLYMNILYTHFIVFWRILCRMCDYEM